MRDNQTLHCIPVIGPNLLIDKTSVSKRRETFNTCQLSTALFRARAPNTVSVHEGAMGAMEGQDALPIIYVNGKRRVMPPGQAEVTLLAYLRGA